MLLAGQETTFIAMGYDTDLYVPGYSSGMDTLDMASASWTASAGTPTSGSGSTFTWIAPDFGGHGHDLRHRSGLGLARR